MRAKEKRDGLSTIPRTHAELRNQSGFVLGLVAFGWRTAEAAALTTALRGTTRSTAFWATETTALAGLTWLTTRHAAAQCFANLLGSRDELLFGDAAIAVSVHALEAFLGITHHAAGRSTFRTATGAVTFWTRSAIRCAARTFTVGTTRTFRTRTVAFRAWFAFFTRGTTETAFTTARRAAFGTAHALALAFGTTAHHLGNLANLFLVNEAVAVGVHAAEALFAFLAAHAGEFVLADLAVAIGVGALDEFGQFCGGIAASWRTSGSATLRGAFAFAFLSAGGAGQAQDADAINECFFEFHVVSAFGCLEHDD